MLLPAANLAVAAALAGLIWTIQVVHYPLFDGVGAEGWAAYEARHQRAITRLVLPLMVANVVLGVAILLDRGAGPEGLRTANAALGAALFLATGALYAPLHGRLADGWDDAVHARLVRLNWWRTVAWTAQATVAVALVAT